MPNYDKNVNRRDLLKGLTILPALTAGAAMAETSPLATELPPPIAVPNKEGHVNRSAGTVSPDGTQVVEHARKLPVHHGRDVIVCGGGPAGVAAALAAARNGAQTTLLEVHGCLGGVWTAGMLCNILDYGNKAVSKLFRNVPIFDSLKVSPLFGVGATV